MRAMERRKKLIGHLYPKVKITQAMIDDGRDDLKPYLGKELIVIAWLWARTVAGLDPSVQGKHVPLVRSLWLGSDSLLCPFKGSPYPRSH